MCVVPVLRNKELGRSAYIGTKPTHGTIQDTEECAELLIVFWVDRTRERQGPRHPVSHHFSHAKGARLALVPDVQ